MKFWILIAAIVSGSFDQHAHFSYDKKSIEVAVRLRDLKRSHAKIAKDAKRTHANNKRERKARRCDL